MHVHSLLLFTAALCGPAIAGEPENLPEAPKLPELRMPFEKRPGAAIPVRPFPIRPVPKAEEAANPPQDTGVCSVPLLNALTPGTAYSPMPELKPPSGAFASRSAALPAPPCKP